MKKRVPALLIAGLMIAVCAAGCGDKKNASTVVLDEMPVKQEETVKVIKPGIDYSVNLGEDFLYETANVNIQLTEVAQTSVNADYNGKYPYAMVFTAKNNGSSELFINMIDDITVEIDGTIYYGEELFTAMSAASAATRYTDCGRYDSTLEAGKEIKGYVPFALPSEDWNNMTIRYKPDPKNTNDCIIYTIEKSQLVDRTKKPE